ncbi:hypothetical protein ACI8AK_04100 [Geodermatophilus sp. SYSU D00867]
MTTGTTTTGTVTTGTTTTGTTTTGTTTTGTTTTGTTTTGTTTTGTGAQPATAPAEDGQATSGTTEPEAAGPEAGPEAEAVEEAAPADKAVTHAVTHPACDAGERVVTPETAESVPARSDDDGGSRSAMASEQSARDAAEKTSHAGGTAVSPPVPTLEATPAPASALPAEAPLSPPPPPVPAPLPPPVPLAPTGSCGTGTAGSYVPGGGQHGGSAQDLAVLGGSLPAPSPSAAGLPHGSDVDPVSPRADDPGSSPD